jgi:hypothetical protein
MRRALIGTALTAIAVLAIAGPANAASAAPADLGTPTITTDKFADAFWATDPVSTSTGFKQKTWDISFDATSTLGASQLFTSFCINYLDNNMNFQKQTCTVGEISSGFSYTLDAANLTHASVRASGIPAQTCSTDANGQQIGQCKPAAAISVRATWTGQGPITYSSNTVFTPGVYRLVQRSKFRNAVAWGTFSGKSLGPSVDAFLGRTITKEWGNPCGTGSGNVVPNGC